MVNTALCDKLFAIKFVSVQVWVSDVKKILFICVRSFSFIHDLWLQWRKLANERHGNG